MTTSQLPAILSNLNRNFPTSDFPTPHAFRHHIQTTYPTFQYQFYFLAYIDLSNISNSFPTSMVFQVNWKLSNFNSWHFPESLFPISSWTFRLLTFQFLVLANCHFELHRTSGFMHGHTFLVWSFFIHVCRDNTVKNWHAKDWHAKDWHAKDWHMF